MSNGEKTEKPSQRKLSKAKEKGQIFKSKDIIDNITLITAVVSLKLLIPFFQLQFNLSLERLFREDNLIPNNKNLLYSFYEGGLLLIKIILPVLLILLIITLALNYAQVGFINSSKSLKMDIKRIDPISGFKRIFSKKSLLELLKFLIKVTVISIFVTNDIKSDFININSVVFFGVRFSTTETLNWIYSLMLKMILILSVFSAFDYFLQKKVYLSEMKMTKQEVKQEYKELEGDPILKGKIKEKQREIATSSLIAAAAEATVLVANPTHIAICIKYDISMPAPMVTAIARDHIALKLKEIAKENNVPIVEDRPLARALFNEAEINQYIPTEFFKVVSQLLITVMQSKL